MSRGRPSGRHYSTHARLLPPARPGQLNLDAIVVPAARDPANLDQGLRLTAELDVQLVLLCSRYARPSAVHDLVAQVPGIRCEVVDLTTPPDLNLPHFETSTFGAATIGSHGDLSLKRNLGLVLGRMSGWRSVLFVDDDIRGLTPRLARRAVGALEDQNQAAAGLLATDYPDNSVVCHARRIGGLNQGVFVSGSALAVDLAKASSFFPQVYNEDWLFLAPYLERRQVVSVGTVRQVPYDPFDNPFRAAAEEFGDVIAEGLIGQLHGGGADLTRSEAYWARFLERRATFIADASIGCRSSDDPAAERAQESLAVSEWTRARLSPAILADYVGAWQADLRTWTRYLSGLTPQGDLITALAATGLRDQTRTAPARGVSRPTGVATKVTDGVVPIQAPRSTTQASRSPAD